MLRYRKMSQGQMQWLVVFSGMLLLASIGWIDYVTGWQWSAFLLYSVPIILVVWKTDWRIGFGFSLLCAATWWLARIESHPYQRDYEVVLAALVRLFYLAVVVVAVELMRRQREHAQARIKDLERTRMLEKNILQASEMEQQRIGRDLHDSLGPHLAAIGYAAGFLADDLRQRDQPEAAQAQQIQALISDAVSLTRDLARGIFPVQMGGSGLSMALEDLANTTVRMTDMSVTFHESGEILVDDPEQGLQIYRIAQEAVHNAVKHGDAKKITLVLSKGDDSLHLVVIDDGKGMVLSENGTRGMGMDSMRYRARMLGGDLKIDSVLGEGTIVSCEVPIYPPLIAEPAS